MDNAVPDFPYPLNPHPCSGYPHSIGADRWYAFMVNCHVIIEASSNDTCQLSVWSGPGCGLLYPLSCATVLPGVPVVLWEAPPTQYPVLDTMYIQVSAIHPGSQLHYDLCLRNSDPWPCFVTAYSVSEYTVPTPVQCAMYSIDTQASSEVIPGNGSSTVTIGAGSPPFSIEWENGSTDFTIAELPPGSYGFTIWDGNGCAQQDTVHIALDPSTYMPYLDAGGSLIRIPSIRGELAVLIPIRLKSVFHYDILNSFGQMLASGFTTGNDLLSMDPLNTSGVYVLSLQSANSSFRLKFLLP